MITRKQYMNKEFTFREYYGQFVTPAIVASVASYIGKDKLLASKDLHLNDIPMRLWDNAPWFGMSRAVAEANKSTHADKSILAVSNCDKVCVLKEAARQFIEGNSQ